VSEIQEAHVAQIRGRVEAHEHALAAAVLVVPEHAQAALLAQPAEVHVHAHPRVEVTAREPAVPARRDLRGR